MTLKNITAGKPDPVDDVSQILTAIRDGKSTNTEQLLVLVYGELRKLAAAKLRHESADHTLQPTALVHEAYMRLVDVRNQQHWESNGHFFAAAAEAMRRILVDHARGKARLKRGGNAKRVVLDDSAIPDELADQSLVDLNDAIDAFEEFAPEKARLVKLRYFAGLTLNEVAEAMGISRATASRHWQFSRAWLFRHLRQS